MRSDRYNDLFTWGRLVSDSAQITQALVLGANPFPVLPFVNSNAVTGQGHSRGLADGQEGIFLCSQTPV